MKQLVTLFIAFTGLVLAQPAVYTATYVRTLAEATEAVTIQQPAPPGATAPRRIIVMAGAAVTCSAACTVTLERDGAVATTTALAAQAVNRQSPAASAQLFRSSDVGTGATLAQYTIPAGGTLAIDLADKLMSAIGDNLTLRFAAMTGTMQVVLKWREL